MHCAVSLSLVLAQGLLELSVPELCTHIRVTASELHIMTLYRLLFFYLVNITLMCTAL